MHMWNCDNKIPCNYHFFKKHTFLPFKSRIRHIYPINKLYENNIAATHNAYCKLYCEYKFNKTMRQKLLFQSPLSLSLSLQNSVTLTCKESGTSSLKWRILMQ
jgi:hypothetical protein